MKTILTPHKKKTDGKLLYIILNHTVNVMVLTHKSVGRKLRWKINNNLWGNPRTLHPSLLSSSILYFFRLCSVKLACPPFDDHFLVLV